MSRSRGRARELSQPGPATRVMIACGVLLAVSTLALVPAAGSAPGLGFQLYPDFAVPDAILGLAHLGVGAVLAARSLGPVGPLLVLVGVGFAGSGLALQLIQVLGPGHAAAPWLVPVVTTGWLAGALIAVVVVPWLLGQPGRGRTAGTGAAAALSLAVLLTTSSTQVEAAPANPLATVLPSVADSLIAAAPALLIGTGLIAALGLARLLTRSVHGVRIRIWIGVATGIAVIAHLCFQVGLRLDGHWATASALFLFVALIMLLTVVLVLVLGEPGPQVGTMVSRATVAALLAAVVVSCYLGFVWLSSMWLPAGDPAVGAMAVAVAALAVAPVQRVLRRQVEALLFGPGADAGRLLERLGSEIEHGTPGDAGRQARPVLEGLVAGLRDALRLSEVAVVDLASGIDVRASDGRTATDPDRSTVGRSPAGSEAVFGLVRAGRRIGELRVRPEPGGRLDPQTRQLLSRISGLIALTLELARVNRQLETARARLVEVRHEERRLLRRELHDGLGPTLSGSALALAAVERSGLPEQDRRLLAALRAELEARCDDVRELARYTLPPALDDGRLSAALRLVADRFTHPGFTVEIDAGPADRLDPARQSAIYHVVAEAVQNASRHAGAGRCRVALTAQPPSGVRLCVLDDGNGMPGEAGDGVGLRSMRERAEELGGRFRIRSLPKPSGADRWGTELVVELP